MIIRKRRTNNYSIIPNEALTDARLSIGARWCLAYLLSKPDHWQVQPGEISKAACVSREKGQQLVRELIDAGWIIREEVRDELGRRNGYHYVVLDEATRDGISVSGPETGFPAPVNPSLSNNSKGVITDQALERAREKSTRGSRIDPDFEPNDTAIGLARELGLQDRVPDIRVSFIDHWAAKAGKDGVKLDWQAAFRTWLRNEKTYSDRRLTNGHRTAAPSGAQRTLPPGEPATLREKFAILRAAIDAG